MFTINKAVLAKYVHMRPVGLTYGNLKVYIPELMPNIPMGIPKIIPVSLNKSCYCNSTDCRPSVASQIQTQNFVTALSSYNSYSGSQYHYGSDIAIVPKTEDCLTCKLAPDECDNSFTPPPPPEPSDPEIEEKEDVINERF